MKCKAFLILAYVLSACTLVPDYEVPETPIDASWPQGPAYLPLDANETQVAEIAWREFFRSRCLQTIIQTALDNNRDLRIAALNIEVSWATYRAQRADLFPTIDFVGIAGQQGVMGHHKHSGTLSEYNAGVGITAFELDLFGRIHSLNERELERYFASDVAESSVRIALIAEVANAYLTYLADQKLLALTNQTLAAQQEAYAVIKRGNEMGSLSLLDMAQAATSVETARTNQFLYTRRVAQDKNALILLVGAPIDDALLNCETLDDLILMQNLPIGLSSDVLLCRPDIRQAEFELRAANANIGAARAAFFPRISLTGTLGLGSDRLADFCSSESGVAWNYLALITQPIFNAGRNCANLDNALAREQIALAAYEKAIQNAFREVSDELAARGTYTNQLQAQQSLVAANQRVYDLSTARFQQGIDSHLNVLDAQRALYSAQQEEILMRRNSLSNLIMLYKVLGGGQL